MLGSNENDCDWGVINWHAELPRRLHGCARPVSPVQHCSLHLELAHCVWPTVEGFGPAGIQVEIAGWLMTRRSEGLQRIH